MPFTYPPLGAVCLLAALFLSAANAQQRVDGANLHRRLLCVVPIVGAGTYEDPKRPMFAPAVLDPKSKTGIIAYAWQPTDDGSRAIVQFVARDRSAFQQMLTAGRADVQAFERGKASKGELERELKRVKGNFDLSQIEVVVP